MKVECLIGLIHNVGQQADFKGLKINKDVHFESMQYADGMFIICDCSNKKLWSIKVVLRGFELA